MRSVTTHLLIDQLDTALRESLPSEPVDFAGEWTESIRRTSRSEGQTEKGAALHTEVVDLRWCGTLSSASPVGALAFLNTSKEVYWVKAPEISSALSVGVSLHAYVADAPERATFSTNVGGGYLPGIPVSVARRLSATCVVESGIVATGRLACLARANTAALFVVLFPRRLLTVGRKRLWRVREEISCSLPAAVGELLTRRRSGTLASD
jgi:hypothetical protein